jgi:hypothetical protein
VRMEGDSILSLTVPEAKGRQHLAPSLRQCVDLYLQAAQCGTNEVVLLWPGTLECLALIHAIATIECWAQGYKQGLRAVMYPATSATFWRLNHVFVDRDDVIVMTNEVREVSFNGVNPAVKQKCEKKDLMLFAVASLKEEAKAIGLQPCINELLPHFYLETGQRSEIAAKNYGSTYLSHLLSKLSKPGHAKELRQRTLPELGAAAVAPDAVFALSYQMTKAQIEAALTQVKALGPVNVVLLDATRLAFERVDRFQNRIAAFTSLVAKVFGDNGPGIVIVTNDPRQMTYVRAALAREAKNVHVPLRFGATHGLCHPGQKYDLGLRTAGVEPAVVLDDATIRVAITDRESAQLITEAYRISREKGVSTEVNEVLAAASRFVNRMANLPSSSDLLHKYLDESMADDAQRRTFDWVAQRNRLKAMLGELEVGLRGRILKWIEQTNSLLQRQHEGTPLARAMLDRIKAGAAAGGKVLVAVQSRFYADLAKEYFLRDPDSERMQGRVHFTALRMMEEKLAANGPTHLVVCALSPDLLRWAITSQTLPTSVDFLLTQQTAQGANYALEPILGYSAYKPYFPRVRALYDPIKGAKGAINAVIPDFDYQAPAFSLTTDGALSSGGERGPTDWVEITIEDGRRLQRGRGARVYIYDPAARESRALGFRVDDAANVKTGDHISVMSEEMREEVEGTFAAAGVTFDEARKYETTLRQYHEQVLLKVRKNFVGSVAEAARVICDAMAKANVSQEAQTVRYWISLKHAAQTPYGELMPQAPRHFATFKVFMEVLGFDAVEIQVFWDGAVKRVRGTRISDGLNLGDRYDRVLFDPDAAATYDGLTTEVLNTLRTGALDNVFEVISVSFGTTKPRG